MSKHHRDSAPRGGLLGALVAPLADAAARALANLAPALDQLVRVARRAPRPPARRRPPVQPAARRVARAQADAVYQAAGRLKLPPHMLSAGLEGPSVEPFPNGLVP